MILIIVNLVVHLCESCLKFKEDCLKKFYVENVTESKEQLKSITEDVAELELKLVDNINDQGKQVEELQQNMKELNKVSIKKSQMSTNKKPNNGPVYLKIRLKL